MKCAYCLQELDLFNFGTQVQGCINCGCLYSRELLDTADVDERNDLVVRKDPRTKIRRRAGTPPYVEIYTPA